MIEAVLFTVVVEGNLSNSEYTSYCSFTPSSPGFFSNTEGFLVDVAKNRSAEINLLTGFVNQATSNAWIGSTVLILLFQPLQAIAFSSSTPISFNTLVANMSHESARYILFFESGAVSFDGINNIDCSGFYNNQGFGQLPTPFTQFQHVTGTGQLIAVNPILIRHLASGDPVMFSLTRNASGFNSKLFLNRPLHIAINFGVFNEAFFSSRFFFHIEYTFD